MNQFNHKTKNPSQVIDTPCWTRMVNEINGVLGFSLARIAYRIGSSASNVQKLVKNLNHIPRDKMFFNLACLYHKLFYSELTLAKAKKHIEENKDETLCNVVIELLYRGFFDDLDDASPDQENKKKYIEIALSKGFLGKEYVKTGTMQRNTALPAYRTFL